MRFALLCSIALALSCGGDDPTPAADGGSDAASDSSDATTSRDSSTDTGSGRDTEPPFDSSVPPFDAGMLPDYPASWPRSRGWDWVRSETPFITALSVRMGDDAPAADVNRYFDDFNATAIQLWEWGLPTAIDGWLAARPGASWVVWVNADGNSGINDMLLGGSPRPPGLIGYQVGDEPRNREQFDRVLAGFARVAAADPDPLRIFNYTFEAEDVDTYLRESCESGNVDVFSYDRYSFGNAQFTTMMKFRDAAIACGIPYWRYLKSYISEGDDGVIQTESDLRWDAFSGLLVGYTGHTWFLYNVRFGLEEGIPTTLFTDTENWGSPTTPRFAIVSQVNQELLAYSRAQTRLRSTGVGWVTDREVDGAYPPDGFPAWRAGAGGDPFLQAVEVIGNTEAVIGPYQDALLGFFEDRYGDSYVIAMNPNHSNGRLPTNTENDAELTLSFDFSSDSAVSAERLLVLGPDGRVFAAPIRDSRARFTIAPGDIVFFKYDTGRGFEGYR